MTERFVTCHGHEFFMDPPGEITHGLNVSVLTGYSEDGYPTYARGLRSWYLVSVWCNTSNIEVYDLVISSNMPSWRQASSTYFWLDREQAFSRLCASADKLAQLEIPPAIRQFIWR